MNINIDYEKCNSINCLECLDLCPMQVFGIKDNQLIIVDLESCCRCQACQEVCSYDAISLTY